MRKQKQNVHRSSNNINLSASSSEAKRNHRHGPADFLPLISLLTVDLEPLRCTGVFVESAMASARERQFFSASQRIWKVSWLSGRLAASFLLLSCLPFIQEENTVTVVPDIEKSWYQLCSCLYQKNMFDIWLVRSLAVKLRSAVWEKLWTGWRLESLSLDI